MLLPVTFGPVSLGVHPPRGGANEVPKQLTPAAVVAVGFAATGPLPRWVPFFWSRSFGPFTHPVPKPVILAIKRMAPRSLGPSTAPVPRPTILAIKRIVYLEPLPTSAIAASYSSMDFLFVLVLGSDLWCQNSVVVVLLDDAHPPSPSLCPVPLWLSSLSGYGLNGGYGTVSSISNMWYLGLKLAGSACFAVQPSSLIHRGPSFMPLSCPFSVQYDTKAIGGLNLTIRTHRPPPKMCAICSSVISPWIPWMMISVMLFSGGPFGWSISAAALSSSA